MERALSQSKLEDNRKCWNTAAGVLSDILKIERENAMMPNFNINIDVFSKTIYL